MSSHIRLAFLTQPSLFDFQQSGFSLCDSGPATCHSPARLLCSQPGLGHSLVFSFSYLTSSQAKRCGNSSESARLHAPVHGPLVFIITTPEITHANKAMCQQCFLWLPARINGASTWRPSSKQWLRSDTVSIFLFPS